MYSVFITSHAKKSAKKLPKEVKEVVISESEALKKNPYLGSKLSGSLHFLYSLHVKVGGVDYRVAYTIDENKKIITVHLVQKREGFYERLKRLF